MNRSKQIRAKGRRLIGGIATAVGVAGAVSVVALLVRGGGIDQARANSIVALARGVSGVVAGTLGEAAIDANAHPWRGLRAYEPELGAWTPISQSGVPGEKIVLLVHGLDEPGGIWDQMAPALAEAGHATVRFDYGNDQPIGVSADELLAAVERLRTMGVTRIDFVCHSMGGLVTRDVLTRDRFASIGIEVERLITIGTPHGGSPWARLRVLAEIREQIQRWAESEDMDPRRLLGFGADGVGEAGRDLLPGSRFLRALDARSFPQSVQVTCIVGRTVPPPGRMADLGDLVARRALEDLVGERDAAVIRAEIEKLGDELGDGVVPVSSAVMEGAEDVVYLRGNHRSMVRHIELKETLHAMSGVPISDEPPAIEVVLDRLE